MYRRRLIEVITLFVAFAATAHCQSPNLRLLLDLSGTWKFELGDNATWALPSTDDSKWDRIHVPSPWEEEGYPGYDGYAWYRKHFKADRDFQDMPLYLRVGYVDDASEVYLNGHMIGYTGMFPPDYETGYAVAVECRIPKEYLRPDGDNVIAVKVYDSHQAGGITHGNVGIYERRDYLEPDVDLSGQWKFHPGDDETWARRNLDDSQWQQILVPLIWDAQGFKSYDGMAWYRTKFRVPSSLANRRLILLLGRIDDMDEVYVNGELIGRTGRIRRGLTKRDYGNDYSKQRAYSIPLSLLDPKGENTIAVRVQDVWLHGGIYDGPVGLIERDRFLDQQERNKSVWDVLKDMFE